MNRHLYSDNYFLHTFLKDLSNFQIDYNPALASPKSQKVQKKTF